MATTSWWSWTAVFVCTAVWVTGVCLSGVFLPRETDEISLIRVPAALAPESFVVVGDIRLLRSCDAAGCSIWLDRGSTRPCHGQVHGESTCFDVLLAVVDADTDAYVRVHPQWARRRSGIDLMPMLRSFVHRLAFIGVVLLVVVLLAQLIRRFDARFLMRSLRAARPADMTPDGQLAFVDDGFPSRGTALTVRAPGPVSAWPMASEVGTYREAASVRCTTRSGAPSELHAVARAAANDADAILRAIALIAFPVLVMFLLTNGFGAFALPRRTFFDLVALLVLPLVLLTTRRSAQPAESPPGEPPESSGSPSI